MKNKQSLEKEQLSSTMPEIRQSHAPQNKLLSLEFTRTSSPATGVAGHASNSSPSVEHSLKLELRCHSLLQYAPCHQPNSLCYPCVLKTFLTNGCCSALTPVALHSDIQLSVGSFHSLWWVLEQNQQGDLQYH